MRPQRTLNESETAPREGLRERAFGQNYQPTLVDRFGVWLSARQIVKHAGPLAGKRIGDFGCGYNAHFIRSVLTKVESAALVDSALAPDLKTEPKVTAIEGVIPDVLGRIPTASLDIILCVSVLEHLWNPLPAIQECLRIVRPNGLCLFNVPS